MWAIRLAEHRNDSEKDLPMGSTGTMRVAMKLSQKSICRRRSVSESLELMTTM